MSPLCQQLADVLILVIAVDGLGVKRDYRKELLRAS